jgi:hypothetical protein
MRVILASNTRIAFAESMDVALRQLLGQAEIPDPDGGGGGGGELPSDAASLVALAQTLYAEAQQALADGDLGLYQDKVGWRLSRCPGRVDRRPSLPPVLTGCGHRVLVLGSGLANTRWPGGWRRSPSVGGAGNGDSHLRVLAPDLDLGDPAAVTPTPERSTVAGGIGPEGPLPGWQTRWQRPV